MIKRPFIFPALLVLALAGCSESPKTEKTATEKPLEPLTGRQAFQQMYIQARTWAPDAQPLQINSNPLDAVKAAPGKSGAWQVAFVSPGRSRAKTFTWSAIESEGNLHKGVFGGPDESWSPSGQEQPFLVQAIKVDSDAAYETALKHSEDFTKKNPNTPVNVLAESTKRFPNPTWRVIWGESAATAALSIFVDASTGEYLSKAH